MSFLFNVIPLSRSNGMPLAVKSFGAALKKVRRGYAPNLEPSILNLQPFPIFAPWNN